jgi:ribonucleotide reductase alpha subunit
MKITKSFSNEEIAQKSLEYFNGDDLASSTFLKKYALREIKNGSSVNLEATPDDMHERLTNEFVKIENKYPNPVSYDTIYDALKNFQYIVPGGSVMYGAGNPFVNVSLSNCCVVDSPTDDISGIMDAGKELANIFKARGGVGISIDTLRPDGMAVSNAAGTSTGAWSFAEYYSNVCRMIGQCLHKDTLILTDNGLVSIKDVNIGHKVWTQSGWVNVIDKVKNNKQIVKLTTKFGKEVLCSKEHVFHTINGEKQLQELQIGDPITQIVGEGWDGEDILLDDQEYQISDYNNSNRLNYDIIFPKKIDEKLAYLLGQIYGDGNVRENEISIGTDNKWDKIIEKIIIYLNNVFNYNTKAIKCNDGNFSRIRISSKLIINHLNKNNLLKIHSINMIFPKQLLSAKKEIIFSFLSGYFDADGCVMEGKKSYDFSSVNKCFLLAVQNILSSFGIVSKLHTQNREKYGWLDISRLTINGSRSQKLFADYMSESIKIQSVKEKIGNFNKRGDFIRTSYKIEDFGSKARNHNYINGMQYISYSTAYRLIDDLKIEKNITLLQDFVKNIEDLEYEDDVYDLILDEEHLFYANGLYAHNSGRRGALMITMNIKHPDIEKFITMKRDLTKVTGANVSIMITDDFMNAVKNDEDWTLQWPIDVPLEDAKITKVVKAKDLWHLINESAVKFAEPGLIFIDNYKRNLPANEYPDFKSICVNPCITGDTKIAVADGRGAVSIKELYEENEEVPVYCLDNYQNKVVRNMKYITLTQKSAPIYKMTLNNGNVIRTTKNHKFLMGFNDYKELKDIDVGDVLFNNKVISIAFDGRKDVYNGYVDEFHNYFITGLETINQNNQFNENFINCRNCSEILLSKFDACRLTSINLKSFIDNPFTDNAKFNYKKFEEITRLSMRIMDDIVDLEIEAIQNLINKVDTDDEKSLWGKLKEAAIKGRRTGLGTHGLADALARLQLRYDSEEAIAKTDKIFTCFRNSAYDESVNLAIERGPFPVFDWEIEKNNVFIQRLPEKIKKRIAEHGRRNISLLTVAPTGTVSIVSQTSSGLEPVFNNMYTRRVKTDNDANVTFTDDKGDKWIEFVVFHHNISDYLNSNPKILEQWEVVKKNKPADEWAMELKKIIPDYFITSHEIDPIKRVEIQGVIQRSIDHGISSTVNMPKETTIEQGQQLYEMAHEVGCKGITIYVDGSRSGVLINKYNQENIKESIAPKRPKELPCEIHHSTIDDNKWTIFVGLLEGKPYEMFGGLSEYITIPKKYKNGKIVKTKNGKKNVNGRYAFYNLIIDDGDDDPLEVQNIAVTFNDGNYAAQTRMISLALRHGVPVQYIAEQLGRDENSNFFSFSKVMARVLKKYIDDGVEGDNCPECGTKLIFEGGCFSCKSCSYSPKCN